MITLLTIITILILSGVCSCSETALYSISEAKVKKLSNDSSYSTKTLLKIKQNLNKYISAIVFANNAVNIFGASILTSIVLNEYGESWINFFTATLTLLIIVFAEIIPKNIGESRSEIVSSRIAIPVYIFTKALTPLIFVINIVVRFFLGKIDFLLFKGLKKENIIDEDEIIATASLSLNHGGIDEKDYRQIKGILHLDDKTVSEIMTPSCQITYVEYGSKTSDNIDLICESQHSRILVMDNENKVHGFILAKKVLSSYIQNVKCNVEDLMIPIMECKESDIVDDVLTELTKIKSINGVTFQQYISIVKNEYSVLTGVITLEDIQEEVFGQIYDETDSHIDLRVVAEKEKNQLSIIS